MELINFQIIPNIPLHGNAKRLTLEEPAQFAEEISRYDSMESLELTGRPVNLVAAPHSRPTTAPRLDRQILEAPHLYVHDGKNLRQAMLPLTRRQRRRDTQTLQKSFSQRTNEKNCCRAQSQPLLFSNSIPV